MTGALADLPHLHSGKVRDLYAVGDDLLLLVASDRISAFDVVLQTPVPDKGAILTAMSAWWFERLEHLVPNHLVSLDDPRIPDEVRGRAMLCRRLSMLPVECVARGYLSGSGLRDYRRTGEVCGVALPDGLEEGSPLPEPVFTPSTKAPTGEHDENVAFDVVAATVGAQEAQRLRELTLAVYAEGRELAGRRGIVLADTKLEFGTDADGGLVLGDEVLTPDSSRYWPADSWQPGRAQPSYDKQYLRDWLSSDEAGWDREGDEPPPPLPDAVVEATRERYVQAYEQLTGRSFG